MSGIPCESSDGIARVRILDNIGVSRAKRAPVSADR
jgi:hypothetical protein